ncbi:hypothetical protein B0O99DRAFT_629760 [Bisporella sp. PMI_857]|nr:hypothetical protein B0O99DRAFT_629760 [Bisporella sp. PMI_857]
MHMTTSTAVLVSSLFISHVVAIPVPNSEKREPLGICMGLAEVCYPRMAEPKPVVPKPNPRPLPNLCYGISCNKSPNKPWVKKSEPVTTRNIGESAVEKREPMPCKGTREACERIKQLNPYIPKPYIPKPYLPKPFVACKGINCNNAPSPLPRISDSVKPVAERDINSAVEKRERVFGKPNSLLGKPYSPPPFACAGINGCGRDPLADLKPFRRPNPSAYLTKDTPNNGIKRDEAEVEKREADQKVEEFLNSLETRDADSDFVNSLGRREADRKVEEFLNSLETRDASPSNDLETRNQPSNLDNALDNAKPANPPFQIPGPPSKAPTNNRRPKRPAKSLFDVSCAGDVHNCSKVKPIRFDPPSIA